MTTQDDASPLGRTTRLVPLGTVTGYRLAAGEPDVRGWGVVGGDGERLGTVMELLLDPTHDEIAALTVSPVVGSGVSSTTGAAPLFVLPMERARIDPARQLVVTKITAGEFTATAAGGAAAARGPAAGHPGVTVERTADGEEIIRVPIVEEDLVVERRPVVKEVVVIRKRSVREEHAVEAELRRERVDVARHEPPIPGEQT